MIMGFISLLLVVATSYIAKICIPVKVGHTMLPCRKDHMSKKKEDDYGDDDARKLLSYSQDMIWGRLLAEANYTDYCGAKVRTPELSFLFTISNLLLLLLFCFLSAYEIYIYLCPQILYTEMICTTRI